MVTQTISLSEEQQHLIATLVSSGRFPSADEVVSAGLRTLERQQREYDRKLAILRAAIDEGDASGFAEGGVEEVFARVRERIHLRAVELGRES